MIKSKPKSIVTQPPGGSSASPAGQSFAASLRSEKKNNDVYIKIPPRSPKLHKSRHKGGSKANTNRTRNNHGSRNIRKLHLGDGNLSVSSSTELVTYNGGMNEKSNDDWYYSSHRQHNLQQEQHHQQHQHYQHHQHQHRQQQQQQQQHQRKYSPVHDPELYDLPASSTTTNSRAALLARRRELRGESAPPAPTSQSIFTSTHQHENVNLQKRQPPSTARLTVEALAESSSQQSTHSSRYASSSPPQSPKRGPIRAGPPTSYTLRSKGPPPSTVAFNTTIHPQHQQQRSSSEPAHNVKSNSVTSTNAREQTRIFRMSGMTPRELIIENLRLQDQMTELQDRGHEALVARSRGIAVDDHGNSRTDRSVNVLASTNADLSRRVQSAVVSEANAMARMQRMEEDAKDQERRFSELVQIARIEEEKREQSEMYAQECEEKLKIAEERVVRLLSRLHAETQNTTRLKKLLKEAENKQIDGDDVALNNAYEQVAAECNELRRQVGELRNKNANLINALNEQSREQLYTNTLDEGDSGIPEL
jgi:hypothetical protein